MSKGRLPEKSSCSFRFCPNEGGRDAGGPCPIFVSIFHKLYILGQFGEWGGRGRPLPKFIGVQKRWGVRGNFDKIQKNSYFFFGKPSLRPSLHSLITLPKRVMGGGNEQSSRLGSWKWPTWQGDVGDQEDDEFDNHPCQCLLSAWKTEPAWTWCEQCGYRRYCNQV